MYSRFAIACLFFSILGMQPSAFGQPKPTKVSVGDDVVLHYVERGKGDPAIFVHGVGADLSFWKWQVDAFSEAGYRAIAYSRRYNYPNQNKLRSNHSAVVEAEDLASLIKQLKLPKAHVVGFSYGAHTSLMLALKYPELVRTVTLAEAPIASWLEDLPEPHSKAAKSQWKRLMGKGVEPARKAFADGENEKAIRSMVDAISGEGKYDGLQGFVKKQFQRNVAEIKALVTSDNLYPPVDREQVKRLAVPTLILSGSESVATARFTDPELVRLIPRKMRKRVVLEEATHIMWVEQPVQSREAVLEFIRDK